MNSIPAGAAQGPDDWPFSDEAAARDAGLIPPDPSTHAALPDADSEELVTSSSDEPTDDDGAPTSGGYGRRIDDGHGDTGDTGDATDPQAEHNVDLDAYPSQPEEARASDGTDRPRDQNNAGPRRTR